MRRIILSLIVISFAGAGFYASTTVNAAELFNSSKKSSGSSEGAAQLFNGSKGLKKVQRSQDKKSGSGLKTESRSSLFTYKGEDVFSMLEQRIGQMNNIAKIVMTSPSKTPSKRGWGPQAFSLEDQQKIYARNIYVAQNMALQQQQQMAQWEQEIVQDQALKSQSWEDEKRARRLAKYGKQVGKALGGYDFPKVLENKADQNSKNEIVSERKDRQVVQNIADSVDSDTSSDDDKVVRKTKTLSTPRLFNNIE